MAIHVLAWVNLFGWIVTLAVSVLLYRSARVRLRAMGAKLARIETLGAAHIGALPAASPPALQRSAVAPLPTPRSAPAGKATASEDEAPITPHATREGDDGRRTSSRPPPPIEVVAREAQTPPRPEQETLTPTDPMAPSLDARIERLWLRKIAAAQEAGQDARHCRGPMCFRDMVDGIAVCECTCAGCALAGKFLIAAKREITGRE